MKSGGYTVLREWIKNHQSGYGKPSSIPMTGRRLSKPYPMLQNRKAG
jgi:hypothetical protein